MNGTNGTLEIVIRPAEEGSLLRPGSHVKMPNTEATIVLAMNRLLNPATFKNAQVNLMCIYMIANSLNNIMCLVGTCNVANEVSNISIAISICYI